MRASIKGTISAPSATPKRPPSRFVELFGTKSACMSMISSASSAVSGVEACAATPVNSSHSSKSGELWA